MKDLQGKTAVVTGGGSGLGRELALGCARRGMHVAMCDVDEAGMAETAQQIEAQTPGTKLLSAKVDVAKLAELEAFADRVFERFGSVYLLCNNAGVAVAGPLWEATEHDWKWVMGVNLEGVAWGIHAFTPRMLQQNAGHIVNTASAAGFIHASGLGIYNATKSAVVAISESLAGDLRNAQSNIGVTVVCPAFFRTGIADSARNRPQELSKTNAGKGVSKEREEAVRKAIAESPVTAHDVADMTLKAVEENRFYVFPHQDIKHAISARLQAAMAEDKPLLF